MSKIVKDTYGNNAAVECPACKEVFVLSWFLSRKGRICPHCGAVRISYNKDRITVEKINGDQDKK